MEHVALVSSQETWLRQHAGETRAWLMPTNNGIARIVKPPLLVWMNLAVWTGLSPQQAPPQELLFRARLVSVTLGLLMLAGIFWLGATLGDLRMAALSCLIAGSMLFFERQARTASYDIEFTAWATLSVAAGFWALGMSGQWVSRTRFLGGWMLAGLFMALSWMTKNPLALVLTVPPLAAAVVMAPRRIHGLVGLLLSLAVCLAVVAPWHVYALNTVPGAWDTLIHEFKQPRSDKDRTPLWYYLNVFGLVFPWCIHLVAGLFHPFDASWRGLVDEDAARARRVRLLPWIWFILIAVFFSCAQAKQQRYILPIVAPAALLIARVWCDHHLLLARAPHRVLEGILRLPHWIALTGVSAAIAIVGFAMLLRRALPAPLDAAIPFSAVEAIGFGVILLAIALLGWRIHARGGVVQAAFICAAWGLTAACMYWFGYCRQPTTMDPTIAAAKEVRRELAGEQLWYPAAIPDEPRPEEEFRFYLGDFIRPASREMLAGGTVTWVLATELERDLLRDLGFSRVREVPEGPNSTRELWRRETNR
jgi:4-amino-4-deoxy-L-arabinose transferase-like glycosyltransferase